MGVLKKKLSFFWLLNRNCNFSSTQLPRKPLTTKTIKQFQLHKHSLLYCHLSTNTAPLPSRNPTHTQTPRFNHNLNRGTGLAQVPPAIGILSKKGEKCTMGQSLKGLPGAEQRLPAEVGVVVVDDDGYSGGVGHPEFYGVFLVAQVGEGSCFFAWGWCFKDFVFLWMPESSWRILSEQGPTTGPNPPPDAIQVARLPQRKALPRGGASVPGGDPPDQLNIADLKRGEPWMSRCIPIEILGIFQPAILVYWRANAS